MKNNEKLFAFKLATKAETTRKQGHESSETKWKARDGAAVAGCTDYRFPGNLRYGTTFSADNGVYC